MFYSIILPWWPRSLLSCLLILTLSQFHTRNCAFHLRNPRKRFALFIYWNLIVYFHAQRFRRIMRIIGIPWKLPMCSRWQDVRLLIMLMDAFCCQVAYLAVGDGWPRMFYVRPQWCRTRTLTAKHLKISIIWKGDQCQWYSPAYCLLLKIFTVYFPLAGLIFGLIVRSCLHPYRNMHYNVSDQIRCFAMTQIHS